MRKGGGRELDQSMAKRESAFQECSPKEGICGLRGLPKVAKRKAFPHVQKNYERVKRFSIRDGYSVTAASGEGGGVDPYGIEGDQVHQKSLILSSRVPGELYFGGPSPSSLNPTRPGVCLRARCTSFEIEKNKACKSYR